MKSWRPPLSHDFGGAGALVVEAEMKLKEASCAMEKTLDTLI